MIDSRFVFFKLFEGIKYNLSIKVFINDTVIDLSRNFMCAIFITYIVDYTTGLVCIYLFIRPSIITQLYTTKDM